MLASGAASSAAPTCPSRRAYDGASGIYLFVVCGSITEEGRVGRGRHCTGGRRIGIVCLVASRALLNMVCLFGVSIHLSDDMKDSL